MSSLFRFFARVLSGRNRSRPVRSDGAETPRTQVGSVPAQEKLQDVVKPMDHAKFSIGQVVKHRFFPFRGVIFDVDPHFNNTEEWYQAIPEEVRPRKDQPYYHLFAENERTHYVAYVSEQNLEPDDSDKPVSHPDITHMFEVLSAGEYRLKPEIRN